MEGNNISHLHFADDTPMTPAHNNLQQKPMHIKHRIMHASVLLLKNEFGVFELDYYIVPEVLKLTINLG